MPGEQLERDWYPYLARGFSSAAPSRSMGKSEAGPFWRDVCNIRVQDGAIRSAPTFDADIAGPTPPFNTGGYWTDGATEFNRQYGNAQRPLVIKRYHHGRFLLLVTHREIHWWSDTGGAGTWTNMTPIYDETHEDPITPTAIKAEFTDSSPTVTGLSGTNWTVRKIYRSMLIRATDGDAGSGQNVWYMIKDVNGADEITLTTNWSGTSSGAGGYTYEIRRCFSSNFDDRVPIFAEVYNGDLYVAGMVGGGAYTPQTDPLLPYRGVPAVIKVDQVFRDQPGRGKYLTSSAPLYPYRKEADNVAQTFDPLTDLYAITGMTVSQDGRVVLAGWAKVGTEHVRNRVYYSSSTTGDGDPSDPMSCWTLATAGYTGGFSDRNEIAGELTALGRLGTDITLHHKNGITLARPSGDAILPFTFSPIVLARQGCTEPRTLKLTEIGEIFKSSDDAVVMFDGARTTTISDAISDYLANYAWTYNKQIGGADLPGGGREPGSGKTADGGHGQFASVNHHDHTYTLYLTESGASSQDPGGATACVIFNWQTGDWVRDEDPPINIMAVEDDWVDYYAAQPSYIAGTVDMVWKAIADGGLSATRKPPSYKLISDHLDGGYPGLDKLWRFIDLWIGPGVLVSTQDHDLVISVSTDGGMTFPYTQTITVDYDDHLETAASSDKARQEIILTADLGVLRAESIVVKISGSEMLPLSLHHMAIWRQLAGRHQQRLESEIYRNEG